MEIEIGKGKRKIRENRRGTEEARKGKDEK